MSISLEDFKIIYENNSISIGKIGGEQFCSYYLITVDGRLASKRIGIKLSKDEVSKITESDDNYSTVQNILNSTRGYIEID